MTKEEYLYPRDKNDDNTKYTMADAVFTACFLSELNRNCDIVGMANFAPIVNTRGCIYTCPEGIVLRSTYHIFDLYVNYLGDVVLDTWSEEVPHLKVKSKKEEKVTVDAVDVLATRWSDRPGMALAVINKEPEKEHTVSLSFHGHGSQVKMYTVSGSTTESYNDVDHEEVRIEERDLGGFEKGMEVTLRPHSVNVIQILE